MKLTPLLCVTSALLLPVLVAAQSASTQPARQRSTNVETRDGSRADNAREYQDAQSPGKSENSKGKKGDAPGQEKKDTKDKKEKKDKKK